MTERSRLKIGRLAVTQLVARFMHSHAIPVTTRSSNRFGDPVTFDGINYVVKAVRTPWEPGVIRVIHVMGEDPGWTAGQLVDLVNGNTGLKLGRYEVIPGYTGRAAIWDLR